MSDQNQEFGPEEAREILGRAAKLQHEEGLTAPEVDAGLTLDELQQAAAEAGIDPTYVAEAAAQYRVQPAPATSGLFGASSSYDLLLTLNGEVKPEAFPQLRSLILQAMGHEDMDSPRTPRSSGKHPNRLTWNHGTLNQITVTPSSGKTEIRARGRWKSMSVAIYGGIILCGLLAGALVASLSVLSLPGTLAVFGVSLVAAFASARTLWSRWAGQARAKLNAAAQAIARRIASNVPQARTRTAEAPETAAPQIALPEEPEQAPNTSAEPDRDREAT
jgi:hypothetical protein